MTCLISFIAGAALFEFWLYLPIITLSIGAIAAVYLLYGRRYWAAAALVAGFALAAFRYTPPAQINPGEATITGLPSPAVHARYGYNQILRVKEISSPAKGAAGQVRLSVRKPLPLGRLCSIQAEVFPLDRHFNPGSFVPKPRAKLLNVISEKPASLLERARARLMDYYIKNLPPDEAAFVMSAITLGERSLLKQRIWNDFTRAGLADVISISGTHFGIFNLFLFGMVMLVFRFLPLRWIEKISLRASPRQIAAAAAFPVLLLYLLMSGMQVPSIRAFLMTSLFITGLLIGRGRSWLGSVLLAAFVILVFSPPAIMEISFQLSFACVLLIGLFAERWKAGAEELEDAPFAKKAFYRAKQGALLTVSLTMGIAPLAAWYFHRMPVISVVSNIIVVPFVGFVLLPIAFFSGVVFMVTGWYPLPELTGALAAATLRMAHAFASMPFASIRVPAFPAGLVILFYALLLAGFAKKSRALIAASILPFTVWAALHFMAPAKRDVKVAFIDTGDGESEVLQTPDHKTYVVDSGPDGRATASYLDYEGISKIDALAFTHSHSDHAGGGPYLAHKFRIGRLWDNGRLIYPPSMAAIPREKLSRGDVMNGAGYEITVLHPYPQFMPAQGKPQEDMINNYCLVLKVQDQAGHSVLLTGDVEDEAQDDMLALGGLLKSDVLKVPHHGSKGACDLDFLKMVRPEYAVISCQKGNIWGFPHKETLDALAGLGIKVFRTDKDGTVILRMGPGGLKISAYNQFLMAAHPDGLAGELRNLKLLFTRA
ncbi:MAG: DNA internalization-related competence protein ComEC/Rec2 [Actinomycetota bacterium]|nr:DNA internalization-related competence protein ComEC/Rec2 [Actinomycetota bacterium]